MIKAQGTLQIRTIEAATPTLAETLRLCKLRAGLSRAENASQYVLGNPKAWLGTAYHEVLAAAGRYNGAELDDVITDAWKSAIEREDQRAKAHPLNVRFGPPETWPGYHLIAAMGGLRAQEFAAHKPRSPGGREGTTDGGAGIYREEKFTGAAGRMVGRPDVVRPEEVIDFKSGTLLDDESPDQIKPSYVRQLRLYAFLVKEALGWWPRRGVLVPMSGSPVEVEIDPQVCEREATDAVRLLDDYNSLVSKGSDCTEFANPSPKACRWCSFQGICPAFWNAVTPEWLEELGSAVLTGIVADVPQTIYCGAALSIAVDVQRGTEGSQTLVELAPVHPTIHAGANQVWKGDEVRVTGLLRRSDGTVRMTQRTTLAAVKDLPAIVVGQQQDRK